MRVMICVLLVCVCAGISRSADAAANNEALFYEANALYQEGQYAEAAVRYEQIRQQGYENGNLYFNLGNSYFRQEAYGKAMVNYERARHFIPHDSDLKANYAHLMERLNLPEQQLPGAGIILRINERLWRPLSLNGRTVALSILYMLILALLFIRLFFRRLASRRWFLTVAGMVLVLFVSGAVALAGEMRYSNRAAVVIAREVPARFEPQGAATIHFTTSEGVLLEVCRTNGGWLKVKRGDGKTGWVDASAVEFVFR